ncbi:regulator of G-protein signaling 22 [Aulostomus maculatus]
MQDNFLDSDDLFVHYLNDFLSQPSFSQALLYNQETGQFEVVSREAEFVSSRIRSALHNKSQLLTHDITELDNHYNVCCLEREHGIQWIIKERLPYFLKSNCYYEYRLAKFLFQWTPNLEYLADKVVKQVLEDAAVMSDAQRQANTRDLTNCTKHREKTEVEKEKGLEGRGQEERQELGKTNRTVRRRGIEHQTGLDIRCYDDRPGLDKFKEFLRGTPGDKLLNLWLDTERLKTTQHSERTDSYLGLMRSRYLLSSSQKILNVELLSRLGLATSPCWTQDKLQSAQPYLEESLLFYWVPRFWTSQYVQADNSSHMGFLRELRVRPHSGMQPHYGSLTLPVLCDTLLRQSPQTAHTQLGSGKSQLLSSRRMEKLFQALCVESRAGLYFTHFCEQSGNQLWENAVYFWTDLQHYHELFYQNGLDTYRVQREAQLLYSTYLVSSARRSIGVSEGIRRGVYDQLMPAYEELFDDVEEHILNILLEPWMLLVSRDEESFQQVCVYEEVRCINSEEYKELQSLYKESRQQLKQMEEGGFMLSPPVTAPSLVSTGPRASDSWSNVSPQYQGYRLGSLLRHRSEIGHFMSFLQNQDASIHLRCWLDMEQYRRTPLKDKAFRQGRSSHIVNKYLNKNYFFSSNSPATAEQQNEILRLAGGLEHLTVKCLSNTVIMEIQDIVRCHIERTWLPLFLATTEFTERQKNKPESQVAVRLLQHAYQQHKTRREAWKIEGLWMSSSKEILLFRRILLNPVTCLQFQHFVSLKGAYMENNLLFWLEVQRYKDLCHSHSDEATIQQKITTIINCFINSSMPPALQIDIPPEHAQHILEKRHTLGPYIFREAQMSVFGELLKFWPEFQELRCSIEEESLLPLLEDRRAKQRAKVRRQRRREEEEEEKEEERRAQEVVEQPGLCFREVEETNDDEDEMKEEQDGIEKRPSRTYSRELLYSTQPLSWSYSKYLAALKREEVLLRRQSQKEATFPTVSVYSSDCSVTSAGSQHRKPLSRSSRTGSKACNR